MRAITFIAYMMGVMSFVTLLMSVWVPTVEGDSRLLMSGLILLATTFVLALIADTTG